MASRKSTYIAMATYQGEPYLGPQLDSLCGQTERDWHLLVRDDGSTDATAELLAQYAGRDRRIEITGSSGGQQLGATANFGRLAEQALRRGADYLCFADQDDVWTLDKLARTRSRLVAEEEKSAGTRTAPRLVHSDLTVVDHQLRPLAPSFLRYMGLAHQASPLGYLTVQNFVTGSTLIANRALLELALPIPPEAVHHDWWFALCAAAAGQIHFVPEPTVFYRQHASNVVGANPYWKRIDLAGRMRRLRVQDENHLMIRSIRQASALAKRLREREVKTAPLPLLEEYVSSFEQGAARVLRPWHAFRRGIRRPNWLLQLFYLARLPLLPTL